MNMALIALLMAGEVIAQGRLPAGTIIEARHLDGASADVSQLVGRQVTRSIYEGKPVLLTNTKEADLVERNSIVRIIGRKGPLKIETKGRALGAGAAGTEIMVMNMESRRTVAARVVGPNTVEVDI
ncbi:MAG: flagellar basal body P-ring formation chaperone FlgA [Pseudomonadota bacterium]